jgi:hypothetical protein
MSRKTIVIKMPQADVARPSEAEAAADARADDRWIHGPRAGPRHAPVAAPGFPIDLAAERSFAEAAALSLALPTMLGWFWLSNTLSRYRRFFGP